MANRSTMHQVGYGSNKNQAFHQGRMLQGARAANMPVAAGYQPRVSAEYLGPAT